MRRCTTFESGPFEVRHDVTTPVILRGPGEGIEAEPAGLRFVEDAWVEVLLSVEWSAGGPGRRFCHTVALPGGYPLHVEMIDADALDRLGGGRQLLRANTRVGVDWVQQVTLQVWQDSGETVTVNGASLEVCLFEDPTPKRTHRYAWRRSISRVL